MSNLVPLNGKRIRKSSFTPASEPVLQPSRGSAPAEATRTSEPVSPSQDRSAEIGSAKRVGYSIGNLAIHRPVEAPNREGMQEGPDLTGQQDLIPVAREIVSSSCLGSVPVQRVKLSQEDQQKEATRLQAEFKRIFAEVEKIKTGGKKEYENFGGEIQKILPLRYESVRPIQQQKESPANADEVLERAKNFIGYIDRQQSDYNKLIVDGLGQSLTFVGYPIIGTHDALIQAIAKLAGTNAELPPYNLTGDLSKEHERVKRVQEKIRFLDRRIQDLGTSPQQSQKKALDLLRAEFTQRTQTPEAKPKNELDQSLAELEKKVDGLEQEKFDLESKQATKLKSAATPDGEFYRDSKMNTLNTLINTKQIDKGAFIGNAYRTSYDVNGGYSLALSIQNMSAYEIHVHCAADGSIAGGNKPVSIKPKGQRYDIGAGILLNAAALAALVPDQATRQDHYIHNPP